MKVIDRIFDIMGFTEISEEVVTEENTPFEGIQEIRPRKSKGQIVPLNANKTGLKVVLLEPETFDECQMIADNLKNNRTVIINLENLDYNLARRVIDFVGGTAYALGGALQKVGSGIVIAVPSNVDISGDIKNMTQPKEIFAWINKLNQGF